MGIIHLPRIRSAGREFAAAITVTLMTILTSSMVGAQSVVKLNMSDIYFEWRPLPKGSAMCGFGIYGNHLSSQNPKIEWDLHVDEVVNGAERLAGISAGTFNVSGKTRNPRAPITDLSFSLEEYPTPIEARLVGVPNETNGVRGTLDLDTATKLFYALANAHQIVATLKYADGSSEVLQFAGFRDAHGGKNSDFEDCLRGRTPQINRFGSHPIP
jgi:hypothetical protein